MYKITLEIKCWEKDYRLILQYGLLEKVLSRNNLFKFEKINLIINNIKDRKHVEELANQKKLAGIISAYYFVEDYLDSALKYFKIDRSTFGKGGVYSFAEIVGLYLNDSPYLLHYSSDSLPEKNLNDAWFLEALSLFKENEDIFVANLTWNNKFHEAESECEYKKNNFYIGYGFSDQMYLIDISKFHDIDFTLSHPDSNRYPSYGGESFEKKVDSWMRINNKKRATFSSGTYFHKNIPNAKLMQLIYLYSN